MYSRFIGSILFVLFVLNVFKSGTSLEVSNKEHILKAFKSKSLTEINDIIHKIFYNTDECRKNLDRCKMCLNDENLSTSLGITNDDVVNLSQYNKALVVILTYALHNEMFCQGGSVPNYEISNNFLLGKYLLNSRNGLNFLLSKVQAKVSSNDDEINCVNIDKFISNYENLKPYANILINTISVDIIQNILSNRQFSNNCKNDLPEQDWFIHELYHEFSTNGHDKMDIHDLEHLMDSMGIQQPHEHKREGKVKLIKQEGEIEFKKCYSGTELEEIFQIDNDTMIDYDKFRSLCPALVLMSVTEECTEIHDHEEERCISLSDQYLYGSISCIVITIVAFIVVVIIGKIDKYKSVITNCLTGLALGTLLTDALLHILPSALKLDDHGDGGHDHAHSDQNTEDKEYVWVLTVTIATIFVLWLFELFFHTHDHDHSHEHNHENHNGSNANNSSLTIVQPFNSEETETTEVKVPLKSSSRIVTAIRGVKGKGWIMVIGDLLHNMTDGLAIAASFSASLSVGLSTAIAIGFHEIPDELSNFHILTKNGFSYVGALCMNILSGLAGFITFLIVTSVSQSDANRHWLFAITAGVFLNISLVHLMSDIRPVFEQHGRKRNIKAIFIVLISFLIGFTAMLLLAFYEESILFDIDSSC